MVYRYHVIVNTEIETGGSQKGETEARSQLERMERQARDSHKRRLDDETKLHRELTRLQEERVRNDQRIATERFQANQQRYQQQIQAAQLAAQKEAQVRIDAENRVADEILAAGVKEQEQRNRILERGRQSHAERQASDRRKELDSILENVRQRGEAEEAAFNEMTASDRKFYAERNAQLQKANAAEVQATKSKWREILRADKEARDVQLGAAGLTQSPDQIRQQTRTQGTQQERLRSFAAREIDDGLRNINRIVETDRIKEADRQLKGLLKTTNDSSRSFSIWGQAFRGAFVGAVAGFTFYALTAAIAIPIQLLGQLGVAGVQAAARLETTTNALRVFTGSTRLAKEELAAIDEVARNTPGLRLETSEQGYQRLRALGFEAQQSREFIKELGEEKILSGASDEALDRIIFNFAQIASGGQKISQELREILTQMPSLRNAFEDAFGSLDYQNLQEIVDRNPDEFFKRLTDAMANQEAAVGGLEDAWGKLLDAGIEAGRTFGEPILDPLTTGVKSLTQLLNENADTWSAWGQRIADVIRGLQVGETPQQDEFNAALSEGARNALSLYFGVITPGSTGAANVVRDIERAGREQRKKAEELLAPFKDRLRPGDVRSDGTINFRPGLGRPEAEIEAEIKARNERDKLDRQAEIARKRQIESLKESSKEAAQILQSRFATEQAALDAHIRYTSQQELEYARASGGIRKRALEAEIAQVSGYYSKLIELEGEGSETANQLLAEKVTKVGLLNDKLKQEEYKTQKEIQEAELRILEERREAFISLKELQERETQQTADFQKNLIERSLNLEFTTIETGYRQLLEVTTGSLNQIYQITRERFAAQLNDAKLTAEQRVNLEKEMQAELRRITQEGFLEALRLADRQHEATIRRFRDTTDAIQNSLQTRGELFQSLQKILEPTLDFGKGVSAKNLLGIFGLEEGSKLLKEIQNVIAGNATFFEVQSKAMEKIHRIERENLQIEIDYNKDLIELEQIRYLQSIRFRRAQLETEKENLSVLRGRLIRDDQVPQDVKDTKLGDIENRMKQVGTELQNVNAEIGKIERKEVAVSTPVTRRLEGENKILETKKQIVGINQAIEKSELARATQISIIKQETEDIAAGLKDNLIAQINEIDLLQERRTLAAEYRETEVLLSNESLLNLARENELQKEKNSLRQAELDLIFRADRADLTLRQQTVFNARKADTEFIEFLASQKGITEIMSDARIGAISAAYSQLDAVIGKLTARFGAFGDVIKDLLSNLIKLALNQVFQRLLGGTGGGTGGGGGFNLSNIFGGGGFQSTPGFAGGQLPIFGNQGILGAAGFGGAGAGGVGTTASVFDLSGNIVGTQTAGLLRPGSAGGASQSGGLAGFLSQFGAGGLTGGLLGGALGASLGGGSVLGSVLGGIGGGIAGLGIAGLLAGFSFTALGAATFGVGLALLPLAYILGRNSKRRKEEQQRNTAILDAFRQIDELIQNVNNDRIDGAQALSQAEQIRAQYVEQMSQLKDSKTRRHALADVSRIDSKITDLKAAVDRQRSRQEYQQLLVPTFADGGATSTFIQKSVKRNPLGYQYGGEAMGYFPKANTLALYNERGSEYILDAETTKAIGIEMLDQIRATKGASFNSMRKKISIPSREAGGAVATPTLVTQPVSSAGVASTGGGRTVERTTVNVYLAKETFVEFIREIVSENNGSDEQVNRILDNAIKNGAGGRFGQVATKFVRENLKP